MEQRRIDLGVWSIRDVIHVMMHDPEFIKECENEGNDNKCTTEKSSKF